MSCLSSEVEIFANLGSANARFSGTCDNSACWIALGTSCVFAGPTLGSCRHRLDQTKLMYNLNVLRLKTKAIAVASAHQQVANATPDILITRDPPKRYCNDVPKSSPLRCVPSASQCERGGRAGIAVLESESPKLTPSVPTDVAENG